MQFPDTKNVATVAYLVEDILIEVGHVALIGHRSIIVISEVLLQCLFVMGDAQGRAQVVGEDLKQNRSFKQCRHDTEVIRSYRHNNVTHEKIIHPPTCNIVL